MRIKNRLFPYPVINKWSDDVQTGGVSTHYGNVRYDQKNYYIPYSVSVENSAVESLIEECKAGYALHIECRGTFFRKLIWLTETDDEITLDADHLEGLVEINLFVCAKVEIPDYAPPGLHPDYEGIAINLKPGEFLAIGEACSFVAEKQYDPLKRIASIIAFDPDPERITGDIKVDFFGEKLVAVVPKKLHKDYELLKQQASISAPSVLSSLLVLPVLMEGCRFIEQMIKSEDDGYRNHRWARILEKRIIELNLNFQINTPFEIAQQILGSPLDRSCNEMKKLTSEV